MNIRKIGLEDVDAVNYCRSVCFKKTEMDFEASRRAAEEGRFPLNDTYAVFDDDGSLMSVVLDNPFEVWFDGQKASCGGIGGVATFPEYRASGCMRALMSHVVREGYKKGEAFSMLAPFSFEFYRKFGYEYAYSAMEYEVPVKALAGFKHTGWARSLRGSEEADLAPVQALIERFGRRHNLSVARDQDFLRRRWFNRPYERMLNETSYVYLLGEGSEPAAYMFCHYAGNGCLAVWDSAFDGVRGLRMMLGFLARMSADYSNIQIQLPREVQLQSLLTDPRSARLTQRPWRGVRVVNVEKALALAKKPRGLRVVVEAEDDLIEENNGRFLVTEEGVSRTDERPGLTADVRALAPMLMGWLNLDSALCRRDVALNGDPEAFAGFFTHKPMFHTEPF